MTSSQNNVTDPTQAREHLWEMIRDIRFAMFTTHHREGHLHSRPMTTQNSKMDEHNSLWFFMSRKGEPVADIAKVRAGSPNLHLIRALRISSDRRQDCFDHLRDLQSHVELFAVLLDTFVPGEFGGTGVTVDPQLVADYGTQNLPRLILAGGLSPDNVAAAVTACQPWGVDTASGVESSPGIKSSEKVNRFITEARRSAVATLP